jgi:hypothetical protein
MQENERMDVVEQTNEYERERSKKLSEGLSINSGSWISSCNK